MINSAGYGSICAHGSFNAFFWMVHIEAQIRDSSHADTVEPGYNEHKAHYHDIDIWRDIIHMNMESTPNCCQLDRLAY